MMNDIAIDPILIEPGLRSRKKAKRRDEIIAAARELFARQGIDATTMADIAAAAGISSPTVFNYFGSKDGILIALISEGTLEARENDRSLHWQDGVDLGTLIVTLFVRVSQRTLDIADKQVWRYAESASIRHPETELSRQYASVSAALVDVVADFFACLDLTMRSGVAMEPHFIAQLFHDVWMPTFILLITQEDHDLDDHATILKARILPLVDIVFADSCIKSPSRKEFAA